jgi:hypothetical protein
MSMAGSGDPSNLSKLQECCFEENGFTRVDWGKYWDLLEKEGAAHAKGWEEAKLEWCEQIRSDLGGNARVHIAPNVILVTDMEEALARGCVNYADEVHGLLRLALSDLGHPHANGRVPLFIFQDDADYYDYLGYHYPNEGTFPASAGIQIRDWCQHVAIHSPEGRSAALTIAHELCHLLVSHLALPTWIDEGVAMKLPRALAASARRGNTGWWNALEQQQGPLMMEDTLDRLGWFWTEDRIQTFWAGTSWNEAGDSSDLSYTLAELLVTQLSDDWGSFLGFLAAANYNDGGQTAALDHLGICLGEAVAPFVEPGTYRPVRKAMVDRWNQWVNKSEEKS